MHRAKCQASTSEAIGLKIVFVVRLVRGIDVGRLVCDDRLHHLGMTSTGCKMQRRGGALRKKTVHAVVNVQFLQHWFRDILKNAHCLWS